MEQWRAVPGFEGWYEVSDLGRVRRLVSGKGTAAGRVMNLRPHQNGYVYVRLSRGPGTKQRYRLHRLVADVFLGPAPASAPEVNHLNGDKSDNRADNLDYVSRADNLRHSRIVLGNRHGQLPGVQNTLARLTEEDVREIRSSDDMHTRLASRFGVSASTISNVRRGARYASVT